MIRLEQLQREMEAAGIALTLTQIDPDTVMAVGADGSLGPLPPGAQTVLAAHRPRVASPTEPSPVVITGSRSLDHTTILARLLEAASTGAQVIDQTRP